MFGLSNIRLIAYGVIALALAGLVAHDHWMSRRYKAQKVETATAIHDRDQSRADFAAYKLAVQQDAALNRKTRDVLQTRLHDIESERAKPAPRLRCYASSVPGAASSNGTPTGANDSASGPVDSSDAFDPVGPALDYAADAARCAATLTGLQEWERERR